jgi:hypothetical protein
MYHQKMETDTLRAHLHLAGSLKSDMRCSVMSHFGCHKTHVKEVHVHGICVNED